MRITAMKTNHLREPLGFELSAISFSWKVDGTSSRRAVASRVEVAGDEEFKSLLHDSGPDAEISNIA